MSDLECRWPPVYDFDGLGAEINRLVLDCGIFEQFFHRRNLSLDLCQGDILEFPGQFPYIDKNGNINIIDEDYDYWIILGNTCDLHRDLPSPHFSHITPLISLKSGTPPHILQGLRSYDSYKKFYIPSWESHSNQSFFIDFTLMCSVDKECLQNVTKLTTRLTRKSWLLLHSCMVRYLARDDGRHD
jgi:hypothetical protein